MSENTTVSFEQLSLPDSILQALKVIGYEKPSPIQEACIPLIQQDIDLIGQAQTGTGKTAAFALPSLAKVDVSVNKPQVCVICPTRELAIQVAEAFGEYAKFIKGFRVLPIYGGQPYPPQLRQLDKGVHVVVGTPGRIMDHMRRGSLKWDHLKTLVLDEADEMLRMGFIDDVEWILEHTPEQRQIALFSATMPKPIKKVAEKFLNEPQHVQIESKAKTASTIEQLFVSVSNNYKLEALTRILESENSDATIIFMRTKSSCDELAKKLTARGFSAEAIHGDMQQKQREQMVQQLKDNKIDIIIATDVAARGLDVERISHVINYDIPHDSESYVHRIGRTGRAGREGKAILFVAPRERHLLRMIERNNSTTIARMSLPSVEVINDERTRRFLDDVQQQIIAGEHEAFRHIIERIQSEHNQSGVDIASALASLLFKDKPLLLENLPEIPDFEDSKGGRSNSNKPSGRGKAPVRTQAEPLKGDPDVELQRYVIHVGRDHGVSPKHIVGAIANEAEMESRYIGNIKLFDDVSTVDLPSGMPPEVMRILQRARVCGQSLNIELASEYLKGDSDGGKPGRKHKGGKSKPRQGKPSHKKGGGKRSGNDKRSGEKRAHDKPKDGKGSDKRKKKSS
ncbi:DEAD/DEAH box helicase [Pleionea litopenaei]|uniref:ATP-dependent RNA helicase DeaD n=1 Tax=Pleionea litopenaei TaxID=3070815 RepID=A0AA51X8C5_9GAMM|nr:DEAD/DEAH box helicase [Pleionea sp. HL-JVS1]WMS88794.1 DEAD/DEAH box helicase [Pleionea sp. HL-JVS1]